MKGIEVCLTGGIGSGKSTVAQMLVELGAKLVDADIVVRELQVPGEPVFLEMVEYFGVEDLLSDEVLLDDGTLNRKGIAEVAFNDSKKLDALNKMVHPPLEAKMRSLRKDYFEEGQKVVVDFPLLVESGYKKSEGAEGKSETEGFGFLDFAGIIVVDCEKDIAVERLVTERGFDKADVLARMAKQSTREARRAVADFLIENSAGKDSLEEQVKKCWEWMKSL